MKNPDTISGQPERTKYFYNAETQVFRQNEPAKPGFGTSTSADKK